MDSNLENTTNEIVNASVSIPAPEKAKKPTGLIATTIFFALLAVAGIAFGAYGMFFNQSQNCATNCAPDTTTDTPVATAPSISEVKSVLEDKFGFKENDTAHEPSYITASTIWDHMDSLDDTAKLAFTIKKSEDLLGEPDLTNLPLIVYRVGYDVLNEQYKYYFGNGEDISKDNLEIEVGYAAIKKITYNPENDSFEIDVADGLGDAGLVRRLSKIISTTGEEGNFSVSIASVVIKGYAGSNYKPIISADADGNEEYLINQSQEDLSEIRESLSVHNLNFIKEDGEYKLVSIE